MKVNVVFLSILQLIFTKISFSSEVTISKGNLIIRESGYSGSYDSKSDKDININKNTVIDNDFLRSVIKDFPKTSIDRKYIENPNSIFRVRSLLLVNGSEEIPMLENKIERNGVYIIVYEKGCLLGKGSKIIINGYENDITGKKFFYPGPLFEINEVYFLTVLLDCLEDEYFESNCGKIIKQNINLDDYFFDVDDEFKDTNIVDSNGNFCIGGVENFFIDVYNKNKLNIVLTSRYNIEDIDISDDLYYISETEKNNVKKTIKNAIMDCRKITKGELQAKIHELYECIDGIFFLDPDLVEVDNDEIEKKDLNITFVVNNYNECNFVKQKFFGLNFACTDNLTISVDFTNRENKNYGFKDEGITEKILVKDYIDKKFPNLKDHYNIYVNGNIDNDAIFANEFLYTIEINAEIENITKIRKTPKSKYVNNSRKSVLGIYQKKNNVKDFRNIRGTVIDTKKNNTLYSQKVNVQKGRQSKTGCCKCSGRPN